MPRRYRQELTIFTIRVINILYNKFIFFSCKQKVGDEKTERVL